MINTFVKIKGYSNWFLMATNAKELPTEGRQKDMRSKMQNNVIEQVTKGKVDFQRLKLVFSLRINYKALVESSKRPILIRENGTYMYLSSENEIAAQKQAENFPEA